MSLRRFPEGHCELLCTVTGRMGSPAMASSTGAGPPTVRDCPGSGALLAGICVWSPLPLFQTILTSLGQPDSRPVGPDHCQVVLRFTGAVKAIVARQLGISHRVQESCLLMKTLGRSD